MINDTKQNQRSGDNSLCIQANNISMGISYKDAKQIALDVYESNFNDLHNKALDNANKKAVKIIGSIQDYFQEISSSSGAQNLDFDNVKDKTAKNIIRALEKGIGDLSYNPVETSTQNTNTKATNLIIKTLNASNDNNFHDIFTKLKDKDVPHDLLELTMRSFKRETYQNIERQQQREKTATYLFDELKTACINENPGSREEKQIDEDWLTYFWDSVERKSSEDIQTIYAKILAGECFRPGSYSAKLLQILSVMTKEEARAFEIICAMSIEDDEKVFLLEPLEEFENFLYKEIEKTDSISNTVIEDLEGLGLLGRGKMVAFHDEDNGTFKNIGGVTCKVDVHDDKKLEENYYYTSGVPFTNAAQELKSIISLQPNLGYFTALKNFADEHLGIHLQVYGRPKA